MKTIKLSAVLAATLCAGAVLVAVPSVSSAANEDEDEVVDVHGWRINPEEAAKNVATSNSSLMGTSLRAGPDSPDSLGFSDPRPGQGDYGNTDGAQGFTNPRPGE